MQDPVAQIRVQMQQALAAEDYVTVARLRNEGWAWLEGWWASEDGQLMRIAPEYGRWTGKAYTAQDIAVIKGLADITAAELAEGRRPGQQAIAAAAAAAARVVGSMQGQQQQQQRAQQEEGLLLLGKPLLEVWLADPKVWSNAPVFSSAGAPSSSSSGISSISSSSSEEEDSASSSAASISRLEQLRLWKQQLQQRQQLFVSTAVRLEYGQSSISLNSSSSNAVDDFSEEGEEDDYDDIDESIWAHFSANIKAATAAVGGLSTAHPQVFGDAAAAEGGQEAVAERFSDAVAKSSTDSAADEPGGFISVGSLDWDGKLVVDKVQVTPSSSSSSSSSNGGNNNSSSSSSIQGNPGHSSTARDGSGSDGSSNSGVNGSSSSSGVAGGQSSISSWEPDWCFYRSPAAIKVRSKNSIVVMDQPLFPDVQKMQELSLLSPDTWQGTLSNSSSSSSSGSTQLIDSLAAEADTVLSGGILWPEGRREKAYRRLTSSSNSSSRDTLQGYYLGPIYLNRADPQLLQLQMGIDVDSGKQMLLGVAVTGDSEDRPAGKVVLRADVSPRADALPVELFPEKLGVQVRYPAEVKFKSYQWDHAELLQFKQSRAPNELTDGAQLGLLWKPKGSEKHVMVLLHNIVFEEL